MNIERILTLYLEHLQKAEYAKSYQQATVDQDIMSIAEDGMEDFLNQNK